jgi:hypothetical protein
MTTYLPKSEHKFTFGLWTVGSTGRDPFGGPVRAALSPAEGDCGTVAARIRFEDSHNLLRPR